jgi:hypothetical protein
MAVAPLGYLLKLQDRLLVADAPRVFQPDHLLYDQEQYASRRVPVVERAKIRTATDVQHVAEITPMHAGKPLHQLVFHETKVLNVQPAALQMLHPDMPPYPVADD